MAEMSGLGERCDIVDHGRPSALRRARRSTVDLRPACSVLDGSLSRRSLARRLAPRLALRRTRPRRRRRSTCSSSRPRPSSRSASSLSSRRAPRRPRRPSPVRPRLSLRRRRARAEPLPSTARSLLPRQARPTRLGRLVALVAPVQVLPRALHAGQSVLLLLVAGPGRSGRRRDRARQERQVPQRAHQRCDRRPHPAQARRRHGGQALGRRRCCC